MIRNDTHKQIGDLGEKAAARFLRKSGYRILERNRHESHNELDIVAQDRQFIVFVEVKTRNLTDTYDEERAPSVAVTQKKKERTVEAARAYLRAHPNKRQPRIDVIEVWLSDRKAIKINHIRNAFGMR